MPDSLDSMLKLLQGSALGEAVRGAGHLYALLEAGHYRLQLADEDE